MAMTPKQLRRYRRDVVLWAEATLYCRHPLTGNVGPLRLQPHQKAWLRAATQRDRRGHFVRRVCVASWPKREGKTLCVSIILAWRMTCFQGQRCGIIANSERQAKSNIYDALTGFFRDSPGLQPFGAEEQVRRLTVAALDNSCECYPANFRTVQGTRFDALACDELHASDDGGKAYTYASQQTEAADAQTLVASQAGAPVESNPLWRLYRAAEGGAGHIYFDYRTEPVTPWAKARAEAAKAELLPGEWEYLWRNAWGATGQKLFAPDLVDAAAMPFTEPQTEREWWAMRVAWGLHETPVRYGVGLDRAGVSLGGDRTVWAVTAAFDLPGGEPLIVVPRCTVLPTGSEAEILAEDETTRAIFGGGWIAKVFEFYGCSDVVGKVRGAEIGNPTAQRQQTLFTRLYRLFAEGRIVFPEGAGIDPKTGTPGQLKNELIGLEYDTGRGGVSRFGTQSGLHDDTVYSLAWATEATATNHPARLTVPADFLSRRIIPEGHSWDARRRQQRRKYQAEHYEENRREILARMRQPIAVKQEVVI